MLRLIAPGGLALFLALGGCAGNGMDRAECRTADWQAIGYEDGSQGRGASALGERRIACADHGVTPGFADYMDGHGHGIAAFCRPQNGYRLGVRGYRYDGVCPEDLEDDFLVAHGDGFGLYHRRASVDQLSGRIARLHKRSQKIERQMVEKTAALVLPQTDPAQRLTLGVELKQLTEERIEIERTTGQLKSDLDRARQELENYSANLARR